ncbi:MAG: hypothetical protein IKQ17_14590 [Kiritimatiellae bacterium]|nr:hypothetical protein [Kiritimatiellia bacterium]
MTTYRQFVLIFAAALAVSSSAVPAKALSVTPGPKTEKKEIGGSTAVLSPASWNTCSRIDALEYCDETVVGSDITHDEPLSRIALRNTLPFPRTIQVSVQAPRSALSTRTVTLGPGASATITLPGVFTVEDSYSYGESDITLFEAKPPNSNGPKSESLQLSSRVSDFHNSAYGRANLLLSAGIVRDAVLPAFKHDFNSVELRRDAADWPRDFRAYLPFDAVCMTKEVADALPEESRAALRAFDILGGAVITFADGKSVPSNIQSKADAAQKRRIGDLNVQKYYYSGTPDSHFTENHACVPINVGKSLPVGLLVFLLLLVAFIVMPGIVFMCAKRNRRLLILAALPGTAFALTLVVAAIALIAYGTTPTVRIQSVTILDPESRLAVTRGQFAVFAPGNVTEEMSIPSDVSFRLRGRGNERFTASFGESCRLAGDWVKPLTATFFDFERAERRSERLDVRPTQDGDLVFANLLGIPVTGGTARFGNIRYKVPPLAPGEQATVKGEPLSDNAAANAPLPHETLFEKGTSYGRNWKDITELIDKDKMPLPDRTYVVRLAGSPFFPSPLASRKTYETAEAVVAGRIADDGGKEEK